MVAYQNSVISLLVIPSGATSGQRIVINGTDGTIDIYNSANQLIATIGGGAAMTLDNGTNTMSLRSVLGTPSLAFWADASPTVISRVSLFNTNGIAVAAATYTDGTLGIVTPTLVEAGGVIELGFFNSIGQSQGAEVLIEPTLILLAPSSTAALLVYQNGSFPVIAVEGATWQNVTFAGNWANAGSPNANVQCIFMPDGTVRMRGLAFNTSGTSGPTVFTLPTGFFPNNQKTFMNRINVPSTNCVSVLVISTAGVATFGCTAAVVASSTISFEDVTWEKAF